MADTRTAAITVAELATITGICADVATRLPAIVPPVAFGDAVSVVAGQSVTIPLLANDVPGSSPIVEIRLGETAPALGSLMISGVGPQVGAVDYIARGTPGADTFTYQAVGADGATSMPATVAITVTAPTPPPPPPPPPLKLGLRGFHPANGTAAGSPIDVMGSAARIKAGLQPLRQPDIVGVWPGKDKPSLLLPGRGMPADIYQRITDIGAIALVAFPFMWFTRPDGMPATASAWDDVIAGRYDSLWDAHLEWMTRQGQTAARIRIVEPGLRGSFPWGIQNSADPTGAEVRAAFAHFFTRMRRGMPGAHLIVSHFKQPHFRRPTGDVLVHPDFYVPAKELYDGDNLDWYDGDPQPISAANVKVAFDRLSSLPGSEWAPRGLNTWQAYAKSRGHSFGLDEVGIVCGEFDASGALIPGSAKPERDNPFFIQSLEQHPDAASWTHIAHFHPHQGQHKILGGTNAGTHKATDIYTGFYNKARA